MKHLLIVILLFISSLSFAQVTASASVNYGLRLDNATNQFNYQTGFTVTPAYKHQKFEFGLRSTAYISNTMDLPQLFTGINIAYPIFRISYDGEGASDNGQHKLILAGHWLYGSQGYQLIGGTLSYSIDCDWNVDVDMSQEYKTKQFYSSVGVSYLIF